MNSNASREKRICKQCQVPKSLNAFYPRRHVCKVCRRQECRDYAQLKRVVLNQRRRAAYHRKKLNPQWLANKREKERLWRQSAKGKASLQESGRAYRVCHSETLLERQRAYRQRYPEKVMEHRRAYLARRQAA